MRFSNYKLNAEYELLKPSSIKRCIFRVNFLIKAAFEDAVFVRAQRLLEGGVYFTFTFLNLAFIGGRRLKEEVG